MSDTCAVCQKAIPTVLILELLKDGAIDEEKHLCPSCAESAGLIQPKAGPMKISTDLLEDLIGGLKNPAAGPARVAGPACPGCGTTAAEFKMSGRLGCARCYETFKGALLPVLERVHDATSHRGRLPGPVQETPEDDDRAAQLRQALAAAIDAERYEEAANLRDKLQDLEAAREEDA